MSQLAVLYIEIKVDFLINRKRIRVTNSTNLDSPYIVSPFWEPNATSFVLSKACGQRRIS